MSINFRFATVLNSTIALLFVFSAACAGASGADRTVIMECGSVKGYSYFFSGLDGANDQWLEDAIDGSKFALVKLSTGEFDIEFVDRLERRSYKDEGMQLIEIVKNERFVTLGAFSFGYNATIYTFDLENRTLGFTVNSAYSVEKIAAFATKCI